MPPYIPPELCDQIIDYLHDDRTALASCALTCHAWLPSSRYHQFRETRLDWKRLPAFLDILSASSGPGIARAIASLEIHSAHPKSTGWQDVDFAFLARLPAVSTLKLTNLGMLGDGALFAAVVRHLQTATSLELTNCWFENCDDLTGLVASFPALEVLALDSNSWDRRRRRYSVAVNEPWESRPPAGLRKLEVTASESNPQLYDPQLFYDWLLSSDAESGKVKPLEGLHYCVRYAMDAVDLQSLLQSIAPTLKDLELVIEQEEQLEAILGDTEFTLAPCTALTCCTLRFNVHEMCVPENKSLTWITHLLSQLSSPHIETLELMVCVDSMEDLRNIASECTVRKLSNATFDDLRALDWSGIERILMHERFGNLKTFTIEGRGSTTNLENFIQERCPDLDGRNILQYEAVKE